MKSRRRTDHVRVFITRAAVNNDTPGTRMEHPMVISAEDLAATEQPDWSQRLATFWGPAPTEWDCWTRQAEQGLLQSLGIEIRGTASRGCHTQEACHSQVPKRQVRSRH